MLVALEGIDGSGKATQTRLLMQHAADAGVTSAHVSFPQYGRNAFAQVVSEYLNGAFGQVNEVHPKLSSLLFAGDRFASKRVLNEALTATQLVVCDRYVASNFAHQAAKLPSSEKPAFIDWLYKIEFEIYGLPMPSLSIYLDVPVATARQLVHMKPERSVEDGDYTSLKEDIHESDAGYLQNCRQVYEYLAERQIAGPWAQVQCVSGNGEMLSPAHVAGEVWSLVSAKLC